MACSWPRDRSRRLASEPRPSWSRWGAKDRNRTRGYVAAQLGRGGIKLTRGQLGQKVCVGLVRQRVFRRFGCLAVIQIAVGQGQRACAHLFEQREITVDRRIDAGY